jgi:L-amino acid N-acyltransferase YncA
MSDRDQASAPASIEPITAADGAALRTFFDRVPEGDRTFFREDVFAPGVIDGWLSAETDHRYVAHDGPGVAGYAALIQQIGWSSHVAEVRVIVDPGHRRQGLGRALARHALLQALELGYTKLVVEVVADQEATLAMFSNLGFEPEALLRDHVRDDRGRPHDLVVMSHFAEDNWSSMTAAGIADAVLE